MAGIYPDETMATQMERGYQLAKYLSCCAASQCAETHICSRRVAKAGAAACAQCGGAGGGSEWAKTFALALCEIFECPRTVQREAVDLVISAVAFTSSSSRATDTQEDSSDNGSEPLLDGTTGKFPPHRGTSITGASFLQRRRDSSGEREGSRDGEHCLGSSWGSVSSACEAAELAEAGGFGMSGGGRSNGVFALRDEGDDDDETVLRGRWFPLPTATAETSGVVADPAGCVTRAVPGGVAHGGVCGQASGPEVKTRDHRGALPRAASAPVGAESGDSATVAIRNNAVGDGHVSQRGTPARTRSSPAAVGIGKGWWEFSSEAAIAGMVQLQKALTPYDEGADESSQRAVYQMYHNAGDAASTKLDRSGRAGPEKPGTRRRIQGAGASNAAVDGGRGKAGSVRRDCENGNTRFSFQTRQHRVRRQQQEAESGNVNGVQGLSAPPGAASGVERQERQQQPNRLNDRDRHSSNSGSSSSNSHHDPHKHGNTDTSSSSVVSPSHSALAEDPSLGRVVPLPPLTTRAASGEFVVVVSREATVKELAMTVGEFPKEWLEEAFGMVVRRQVEEAAYDARARAAMKRAVRLLEGRVSWKQVALTEQELAAMAHDHEGRIIDGDQNKEAPVPGRYWKVGLAAAGGGMLLFLSGGVAAPSVSASLSAVGYAAVNSVSCVAPTLGAWLGYTSASAAAVVGSTAATGAAVGTAGSIGTFSAVSGAAGAGVAGYKMTRRTAGVQEFHFLPLHSKWPLDAPESMFEGDSEPGLPVFICVPGWHEPGHDPRHTWGGVGCGSPSTPPPPSTPPGDASLSRAATGVDTHDGLNGLEAEGNKNIGGAAEVLSSSIPAKLAVAPSASTAQVTASVEVCPRLEGKDTETIAGEATAATTGVSRFFSSPRAPRCSTSIGSSNGSTSSAPHLISAVGRPTFPARAGTAEAPGTISGTTHGDDERFREAFLSDTEMNGDADGHGMSSPRTMGSSFIDLGAASSAVPGKIVRNGNRREHSSHTASRESGYRPPYDGSSRGGVAVGLKVLDKQTPPHSRRATEMANAVEGGDEGGDDMDNSWEALPSHAWWRDFVSGGEEHVLVWERGPLMELHSAMRDLAWKSATRRAVNEAIKRSALAPVIAAAAWPLALLEAASGLDDPWGVVRSRALEAGRLLAAVLLSRPVGSRPVTLLGYSMGAKVIFNCLEALAAAPGDRGLGIVENAVMLGTPVGTKRGRWKRARSAVAGRIINGYSSRDWLLALVYRSKSWSVGVAGTSRVEGCGVENVDLSNLVVWHLNYSRILPTVMAMLRLEE